MPSIRRHNSRDNRRPRLDSTETVSTEEDAIPDLEITLFPNPFSDQLTITLELDGKFDLSKVKFAIYNSMGQLVEILEELPIASEGTYSINWNPTSNNLPGGIYHLIVQAEDYQESFKLVYLKP